MNKVRCKVDMSVQKWTLVRLRVPGADVTGHPTSMSMGKGMSVNEALGVLRWGTEERRMYCAGLDS